VGRDSSVGIATCCEVDGPGIHSLLIPVTDRSKARVCGRSLAGVADSNLAGGMDVCVVCCKERQKRKMQHSQDKETSTDEVQTE
jgi:hypothetical protein